MGRYSNKHVLPLSKQLLAELKTVIDIQKDKEGVVLSLICNKINHILELEIKSNKRVVTNLERELGKFKSKQRR